MNALDFAGVIRGGKVNFGIIPKEEIIVKLREIADRLEKADSPRLVLEQAYSGTEVNREDFVYTTLILRFAEISPEARSGTKLWDHGPFPVEVKP